MLDFFFSANQQLPSTDTNANQLLVSCPVDADFLSPLV